MKVCIIGDGLISLALAKALVNRDIFVEVINSKKPKNYNQNRTLGISKSNIEFFNTNILNIRKFLWEIKRIKIKTENSENEEIINFSDSNTQLFSVLLNQKLFKRLKLELIKSKFFNYKMNMDYKNILKEDYRLIINITCSYSFPVAMFFRN